MTPHYVELHARSAFSFLRGGSFPEQLAERAAALGMPAMALCDRDGVYGAPRFLASARECKIKPVVGAELTLDDGSVLPVLVASRPGYNNLCRLITRAKLRGTKQNAPVNREELAEFSRGLIAMTGDGEGPLRHHLERDDRNAAALRLQKLIDAFGRENVFVEVQRHLVRGEETVNAQLFAMADHFKLPLLATNGVLYAEQTQRKVVDVFTCIRNHTHLDAAGRLLNSNDERYVKGAREMALLFSDRPEAVQNSVRLAERLEFTLENLGYQFPAYNVPPGETMNSYLHRRTMEGVGRRYSRLNARIYRQLKKELDLIAKLGFSGYFLIVWDIVNFCREHDILVQGRGSAANSVVCYALGITACDPISHELLFERFLTETRETWPDIDLDLPSGEKRESVIQEVYRRYSPNGAAMTANVISFRGRSAMREIGKALNFSPESIDRFSKLFGNGDFQHTMQLDAQLRQAGIPPGHPRARAAADLYRSIYGLPRHLGQHSGGMIICQGQLDSIVPLENASMPGRVVAQWDKDDCEDLKIIKVDFLGLGMMAALHDTFQLCAARGRPIELKDIPHEDTAAFDLMCKADTIGTFQVESRAQMATLPRLQPRTFYDVAIQVAIIRPGPITGGMLNSYIARRTGKEEETYYDERLCPVLRRTLGIPLFQEQLLRMAMVMGDFTGSEAEELRRALSFHRSQEKMNKVCIKLRAGMERKNVLPDAIEKVIEAVQSFAVYGFPESHAISFALLAYASCWLKVHRAPEFYAGLLNNQPMGFYSPDTLIKDAKRRGVRIRHACVLESDWICAVEKDGSLRLGLCFVRGLGSEEGRAILETRNSSPFSSLVDFQTRTGISKTALRNLAKVGALNGVAAHRRDAQWKVEVRRIPGDLFAQEQSENDVPLLPMNAMERMQSDYGGLGLTTGPHPMSLLREKIPDAWRAADLTRAPNGAKLLIAGVVICRQRPGTAKGFVFISLEDESGVANAIVTPQLFEKYRLLISEEPFLAIEGILQNHMGVIHVKAHRITPLHFGELSTPDSHDFR